MVGKLFSQGLSGTRLGSAKRGFNLVIIFLNSDSSAKKDKGNEYSKYIYLSHSFRITLKFIHSSGVLVNNLFKVLLGNCYLFVSFMKELKNYVSNIF